MYQDWNLRFNIGHHLISDMLDTMVPFHKIDLINWKEFNYSPFVSFPLPVHPRRFS